MSKKLDIIRKAHRNIENEIKKLRDKTGII